MTEKELRRRLARKFGDADVPDEDWTSLTEGYYVRDALEAGYTRGWPDLVKEYEKLRWRRFGRRRMRSSDSLPEDPRPIPLTGQEQERAVLVSRVLIRRASALPSVGRFRRSVLAGKPLSPEKAAGFVSSPALAIFPKEELEAARVPFLTHESFEAGLHSHVDQNRVTAAVFCSPPGLALTRTIDGVSSLADLDYIAIAKRGGKADAYQVLPGSVLDDLRFIGADLNSRYMWRPEDAVAFVLTNQPPLHLPIVGWTERQGSSDFHRGTIRIEAEASVSAASVTRTYRRLQASLIGYGRDNRPIGPRSLFLIDFVEEWRWQREAEPDYGELLTLWNEVVHEQYQYVDRYKLKHAYENAVRRLLTPDLHLIDDGVSGDSPDTPFVFKCGRTRWEPVIPWVRPNPPTDHIFDHKAGGPVHDATDESGTS